MKLELLRQDLSISRLPPEDGLPAWLDRSRIYSVSRTPEELSIISESSAVPPAVTSESGWCLFKLAGTQPFSLTGVLSSILAPLAEAGVSILAFSTYDTDYVMVKRAQLDATLTAWTPLFELSYYGSRLPIQRSLESERLLLRSITEEDAEAVFDYAGDGGNTRYMAWSTHGELADSKRFVKNEAEQWLAPEQYNWGIEENESGRLIGTAGLSRFDEALECAELGFILHRDFWRLGYATEAASRVISYGFEEVAFRRIVAHCFIDNAASKRVLEKLGMRYVSVVEHQTCRWRDPVPAHQFELLLEEYLSLSGKE